jgi:hypothetical protein
LFGEEGGKNKKAALGGAARAKSGIQAAVIASARCAPGGDVVR